MTILGIETSCDDTGVAVLEITEGPEPQFAIRSNTIASQIDVHQEYGGVFPSLAKREHIKNLPITLEKSLKEAGVQKTDAIAVTYGPGLSPCLWAGLNFAKELAKEWGIPLTPTDHIEGHLLVALLKENGMIAKGCFPAIALTVAGGHTQLTLVNAIGQYKILGETRDDAAGECFDKTARILGLPYPGGPAIAQQAAQWKSESRNSKFEIKLPRPMLHTKDYDFSFSGLKTAVLYDYKDRPQEIRESKEYIQEMASEIQQSVIDVLLHKTLKAAEEFQAKSVVLGGGVSANEELRKQLSQILNTKYQIPLLAPPKNLSTDNGLMIALAGYFQFQKGNILKKEGELDKLEARPNLRLA